MLSYSYTPRTSMLSNPVQPPKPQQQPIHKSEDRILENVRDDLVTLDYLVGIQSQNQGFSFVYYRPTEKHKKCAGSKIDPVRQINMFIQTLRDTGVIIETSLHTVVATGKKYFWMRVSLADLSELSLEPLWMINGRVKLYSKHRRVMITITDQSLEPCFLNPQSQLLDSLPNKKWYDEYITLAKECLTCHAEEGVYTDNTSDEVHSKDSRQRRACEDGTADGVRVVHERKRCKVDQCNSIITASEKKRKRLDTDLETDEQEKDQGERNDIPNVIRTDFNSGMQTRLKSRQRQHVKRRVNAIHSKTTRYCRRNNTSKRNVVHNKDQAQPLSHWSSVTRAEPHQIPSASDIASHGTYDIDASAVTHTAPDHQTAQRCQYESTNPCVSDEVSKDGDESDSMCVGRPPVDTSPIVTQTPSSASQPRDILRNLHPQSATTEGSQSLGCLLM